METLRWFNVEVIQTPTHRRTLTLMQKLGGNGPLSWSSTVPVCLIIIKMICTVPFLVSKKESDFFGPPFSLLLRNIFL